MGFWPIIRAWCDHCRARTHSTSDCTSFWRPTNSRRSMTGASPGASGRAPKRSASSSRTACKPPRRRFPKLHPSRSRSASVRACEPAPSVRHPSRPGGPRRARLLATRRRARRSPARPDPCRPLVEDPGDLEDLGAALDTSQEGPALGRELHGPLPHGLGDGRDRGRARALQRCGARLVRPVCRRTAGRVASSSARGRSPDGHALPNA